MGFWDLLQTSDGSLPLLLRQHLPLLLLQKRLSPAAIAPATSKTREIATLPILCWS